MKNRLLLLLLVLLTTQTFAQEEQKNTDSSQNFNEVKLNGLYLVVGAFEVTYERTLNEESAIGITAFLPISEDVKDDIQYYISPYYRMYFGKKYAAGFFVEGFAMLNSLERNLFINEDEYVTDLAIGIGLGGKWITKKGFIGELNLGFGRNLFNNDETDFDLVSKGGITIGYRF